MEQTEQYINKILSYRIRLYKRRWSFKMKSTCNYKLTLKFRVRSCVHCTSNMYLPRYQPSRNISTGWNNHQWGRSYTYLPHHPTSVTRFSEFSSLWWNFRSQWQLFEVFCYLAKILTYIGNCLILLGKFTAANGQILKR